MSQLPELLEILTLKRVGENEFLGKNLFIGSPNVYGGQVLAQAISAANTSVHDHKVLHSIHSYLSIQATMIWIFFLQLKM